MDDILTRIVELAKPDELPAIARLSQRCRSEIRKSRGSHFYGDWVLLLDAIRRDDREYIYANYRINEAELGDDDEGGKFRHIQLSPVGKIKVFSTLFFANPEVKNRYMSHHVLKEKDASCIGSIITNIQQDYVQLHWLSTWTFEMGYYCSNKTLKAMMERMSRNENADISDFIKGVIASGRAYRLRIEFIPPGVAYGAGYKKFTGLKLLEWIDGIQARGREIVKKSCARDVILDMLRYDLNSLIRCNSSQLTILFKMTDDKLARRMLASQIRRFAPILDLGGLISYLRQEKLDLLMER